MATEILEQATMPACCGAHKGVTVKKTVTREIAFKSPAIATNEAVVVEGVSIPRAAFVQQTGCGPAFTLASGWTAEYFGAHGDVTKPTCVIVREVDVYLVGNICLPAAAVRSISELATTACVD